MWNRNDAYSPQNLLFCTIFVALFSRIWFSHSWSLLHSFFPSLYERMRLGVWVLFFVSDFCFIWIIFAFAFCRAFFLFFFLFDLYSCTKFDIVKRKYGFEIYRIEWELRETGRELMHKQKLILFGLSHGPTGFLSFKCDCVVFLFRHFRSENDILKGNFRCQHTRKQPNERDWVYINYMCVFVSVCPTNVYFVVVNSWMRTISIHPRMEINIIQKITL